MAESRRILITGISRGLGRAMTGRLIDSGHTVIGCARDASAIQAVGEQWTAPHRFDVVDVSDESQVASWARSILDEGGPPD